MTIARQFERCTGARQRSISGILAASVLMSLLAAFCVDLLAAPPHSPPPEPAAAPESKGPVESESKSRPAAQPTLDELLLFYPAKHPQGRWKPEGLEFSDVWFTSDDGVRLHGWYCPAEKPKAVLLYCHGNAGNLSYDAPLLVWLQQQAGVSVLDFDYRGYGRSEGSPSVDGILRDARAARAALAEKADVPASRIVLMGRSLGGAVAVRLAAESRPRGLVLESTFTSMRDLATHHYPRLAWLVPPDKLNSIAQLAKYDGPLLQSHGDADRVVPYTLGVKLHAAAKEPKKFVRIPRADHNDASPAEYYRWLARFLDSLPP